MTIEGIKEFEALRDFLYSRMRGVKDHPHPAAAVVDATTASGHGELVAALRETTAELRAVREVLANRK